VQSDQTELNLRRHRQREVPHKYGYFLTFSYLRERNYISLIFKDWPSRNGVFNSIQCFHFERMRTNITIIIMFKKLIEYKKNKQKFDNSTKHGTNVVSL